MNIAILIPELGGGGAERVAQIVGDYYVKKGNKVYYFLADTDVEQVYPVDGTIVQTSIKSCMEGKTNDIQRIIKIFYSSMKMRRLKKQYKIDVAISFMEEFNYINVLSKGKEKVVTRVCAMLSAYEKMNPENLLFKKYVIHFFYSKADRVIVLSKVSSKEMQVFYKIPGRKIVCIPNMAVPQMPIKQEAESWEYGKKAVICIGRLMSVKQHERIIRAFSYVCSREPDAKLIILGRGPQLKYLKRICKVLQIEDKVIFEGFTDNVPYYLQHSRVFVMGSRTEAFPNSMMEAMYYGVPVVTTDSFGACGEIIGKPEKIKNKNTVIFCKYGILTPDMPDQKLKVNSQLFQEEVLLGKAIQKVLTEDEIYERYRTRSLERAEMFAMDKVIKKWNSIVEK